MKTAPKTRTSAERYNRRMAKIWENARRLEAERIARGEEPNPNLTAPTPLRHTPGPWEAERMFNPPNAADRRCGFVVNAPQVDEGGGLPRRVCDMRVPVGMGGFSEGKANARLIAAAPELLAALELITVSFESHFPHGIEIATARAAIAKAKGQ